MLGVRVNVEVDQVVLTPTPRLIVNELDQVAKVMGFTRYKEEKTKDFKDYYQELATEARKDSDQQNLLVPLELRSDTERVIFENNETENRLNKVVVTDKMKLRVTSYSKSGGTDLFDKTTFEYDLLDRRTYPFLEDVLNQVNSDVPGLYSYISPFANGRNNHLLPYHLAPGQVNYMRVTEDFQQGTDFVLLNKFPIPDTLELLGVNLPPQEASSIQFIKYDQTATAAGEIKFDYWNSYVTSVVDYSKYESLIQFDKIKKVSTFKASPGVAIFNYSSTSVLDRMNNYENVNDIGKNIVYNQSSTNTTNGYSYSGAITNQHMRNVYEESNLKELNANRWG